MSAVRREINDGCRPILDIWNLRFAEGPFSKHSCRLIVDGPRVSDESDSITRTLKGAVTARIVKLNPQRGPARGRQFSSGAAL